IGSDNSWLVQSDSEGYGYANPNGDLDIIGESSAEDILGVTTNSQFRIERIGCQKESSYRYFSDLVGRERTETGTYSGTQYDYTQVTDIDGFDYTVTGSRWTDTSYEQAYSYDADTQTYTGTETGSVEDRTSSREYTQTFSTRNGEVKRVGTIVTGPDGSSERSYVQTSQNQSTEWTYTLDYAGNGSGTVSGDGFTCDLTYQNDNCTYRCPSGQTGNC
ncbi:MAG: hypothetical protein AB8H79_25470, partial [Myxococcota bacterium]